MTSIGVKSSGESLVGSELSKMRQHNPKSTRARMGFPKLPRHPVPVRMRRQIQPIHRHQENLHHTKTPNTQRPMLQLQNTQPNTSPLLQELRNKAPQQRKLRMPDPTVQTELVKAPHLLPASKHNPHEFQSRQTKPDSAPKTLGEAPKPTNSKHSTFTEK